MVEEEAHNTPSENETEPIVEAEEAPPVETRPEPSREQLQEASRVRRRFTGCGHCSLFLTDYLLNEPRHTLVEIVSNRQGDQLSLPWNNRVPGSLHQVYGLMADDMVQLESTCPECRRKFAFETDDAGDVPYFVIDI